MKKSTWKGNLTQGFGIFYQIKCCQSVAANDPANEGDKNGPESKPAPLKNDEDTQLGNIQDKASNLTYVCCITRV